MLTFFFFDDIINLYGGEKNGFRFLSVSLYIPYFQKGGRINMKTGKKLLSVLLSLIMIVSTVSVSFSTFTVSAVDGNDLKSAFSAVTDTADLKNGDGTLLNAAEVLYNYVYGIASTSCNGVGGDQKKISLTAKGNNSSVDLNKAAKSALNSSYNALIDNLIPTSGVTDDSSFSARYGSYSNNIGYGSNKGFDTGKLQYGVTASKNYSVTVSANLEKILLGYTALSDVPSEILTGATYSYSNAVKSGYKAADNTTKNWAGWKTQTWTWSTGSWHTLSQKPTRTGVKTDTTAYKNLHAFADWFTSERLSTSLKTLCELGADEINALITSNNEAFSKLASYSDNVKNHFFDMTAVQTYMNNCLYAQKVINARPAMDSLNAAMKKGYDANNLDEMNSIYTAQKPNFEFVKSLEAGVVEYVKENFEGYSDFTVESAEAFMNGLDKDIQLYKIRQIKSAVDSLRAQYPDAEAIKTIEDNQLLWNYYDLVKGYVNTLETAFDAANVAEVFTDGTGYVKQFEEELKFEFDYREAQENYDSFWSWFLPLVYADLTKVSTDDIIGTNVAETVPNIKNAVSKKSAFDKMYEKYLALIGEEAMETIFGAGENALGYIIDDYIARLYNTILARLESEVNTAVGYYDAYGEVNFSNFTAIKDAIGRVETDIWNYLNKNNSSIISSELRANYERLSSLLSMYDSFVKNGGLSSFEQKHLHDSNGIYMTRDVTDEDLARKSGEEYNVTEKIVNETIEKLDRFLTSDDFTNLVNIDADSLSDYIKQVLADNLYTDDFVNMLAGILYPELTKALEDLYNSLPRSYRYNAGLWSDDIKIGYKSLEELINGLGIGLYPNQVAGYIDGFSTVRSQLSSAGKSWSALKKDGKLTLNWGIDSVKRENYSSTSDFINAKKAKFMSAMSESFDAILPLIRVLIGDWDGFDKTVNKAGYGEYLSIKLNADLNLTADGCAGYSDLVVPILEALGCSQIQSYNTVKGYTQSRQFVDAIFEPLIDFVENKLAKSPVSTLCSVLPNLAYAVSMDKLWDRFKYLNITLNYKANDSILNIQVVKDSYTLKLADFVSKDSLGLDFDVSSFSSIVSYLVGMFVEGIDSTSLPVMNAGSLITYASLDKNASTKRVNGSRINFTADKADVFMALLDYLTRCLGNSDFVNLIYSQFSKDDEMTPELKTIIENIYTSTSDEKGNMALAAIIELLNQTQYALEEYTWVTDSTSGGTVEGVTPASKIYLTYGNDWTKKAASYVANNLSEIINSVMKTAGNEVDISGELKKSINSLFTNSLVTSAAKGLASLISLPEKLTELINSELGVDLSAFEKYKALDESFNWGFEDGDRDGFTAALLSVLSPLEPLFGFLFKGESVHLFKNSADVVLYGNDGYDNALVPLLEALGCVVKGEDEFGAKDTLKVVLEALYERIDRLSADPVNGIVEMLPGVIYYVSSNALSTAVKNLLHPIDVIIDTIRPVYKIDVKGLASSLDESIDLEKLDASFVKNILESKTGLKLDDLDTLLVDVSRALRSEYSSKSSFLDGNAYRGEYSETDFDRADMLTVVISAFLEILSNGENASVFDELIGTENFTGALLSVFKGTDPETKKINWMYYFGEDTDFSKLDFENGVVVSPSIEALTYPNNWTANAAEYVSENLDSVISTVLKAAGENGSLSEILKSSFNLYTPENLEKLNAALLNLVQNADGTLLEAANVVLGLDLEAVKAYKAPETISSSEEFVSELLKIVRPVQSLVDWLLFSKDYSFFTGTQKDENGNYIYNDLITVKGADGYKYGLIPVLEALGCKNIPDAEDENVLQKALESLFARVDEILDNPADEILNVLPNVIYFLNADGLTASVGNLLSAVNALSASLEKLGVKLDVSELLGIDLNDLSFEKIVSLVESESGLDLTAVKGIFGGLCVGTIKQYLSKSGEYAFSMTYTKPSDKKDMLTLLITAFVETVKLEGNESKLREILGENTYDAVLGVLNLRSFEMQKPSYKNTEYADTDKTFSAIESSVLYSGYKYGPLYTREMAQYIADNIDSFIDNLVYLLGIEINGSYVGTFEDALKALVGGSLYNSDNAQKLLDKVLEFTAKIDEIDGSEHIKALIKASVDVDLDAFKKIKFDSFENDREKFTEALCEIARPLYPVLKWMLCNEDISFFVDEEKNDLVTLLGSEGYAYGIIPLLETLDCEDILTPSEYIEKVKTDDDTLVRSITEPLFDRLDEIMKNPAEEILQILPQIIYFVNSNGLDTCFKNALHSVYGILAALEPLVKVDLYSLINIRLDEVTFESLYKLALEKIAETTGQKLDALEGDAFLELTVGKLVSYTSLNGEKAYKMVYQSNTAKAEMVTVIERLVISFIISGDNRTKLINILKDKCNMSADAEKYVKAVLDLFATYTGTHFGMDQSLFALYEIFYGAKKGTDHAAAGLKKLNEKWKEILKMLNGSDDPNAQGLGTLIGKILDENLSGIIDSDGIASSGFIVFWKNLLALFKRIGEFFKNLFK